LAGGNCCATPYAAPVIAAGTRAELVAVLAGVWTTRLFPPYLYKRINDDGGFGQQVTLDVHNPGVYRTKPVQGVNNTYLLLFCHKSYIKTCKVTMQKHYCQAPDYITHQVQYE
jgi:hypothetical protein